MYVSKSVNPDFMQIALIEYVISVGQSVQHAETMITVLNVNLNSGSSRGNATLIALKISILRIMQLGFVVGALILV